jgi:hypothetical protein
MPAGQLHSGLAVIVTSTKRVTSNIVGINRIIIISNAVSIISILKRISSIHRHVKTKEATTKVLTRITEAWTFVAFW